MNENYFKLKQNFDNFKEILTNGKFKTINKFVILNQSFSQQNFQENEILGFIDNFYQEFNEKITNETLKFSPELSQSITTKLSFVLNSLESHKNKDLLLQNLIHSTTKFFAEKLILFNQEYFNQSKFDS